MKQSIRKNIHFLEFSKVIFFQVIFAKVMSDLLVYIWEFSTPYFPLIAWLAIDPGVDKRGKLSERVILDNL